jgi:membrane protein YdbS with pleckstrin-like domain
MDAALGILHFLVWIYAVVQIMGSRAATGDKVLWILVVLILPLLGLVIWLFLGPGSPRQQPR